MTTQTDRQQIRRPELVARSSFISGRARILEIRECAEDSLVTSASGTEQFGCSVANFTGRLPHVVSYLSDNR